MRLRLTLSRPRGGDRPISAARGAPGAAKPRKERPIPWLILGYLALLVAFVAFGDLITRHAYDSSDLLARNRPPLLLGGDWNHPLGTDPLGRDVLARLLMATRVTLAIALLGTVIGAVLGSLLGFIAAARRGATEESIMMAVDVQASMPFIIIALAVLAFFGNSLILFIGLMGIYGWEQYARMTRGAVLAAKEQPYAKAARALGAGPLRIYGRHILPNIAHVLIVQVTLNFPQTVLLETGLSFLGLGIQRPLTSLGHMLSEGRDAMIGTPWVALIPGTVIFLTTLSLSLLGDRLRDYLDPKLRARRN